MYVKGGTHWGCICILLLFMILFWFGDSSVRADNWEVELHSWKLREALKIITDMLTVIWREWSQVVGP